ncbi:putative addiction module antidote protein [Corynebacterium hylobatis]|uniref:Putative addiction module antidote protein n=1 Tax=Corynebacterium hylobatis TaxID=1859290 RepID=A0A3S0BGT1_9CORY|nr:addiction module antidote protein [Corynebacterium hylobatis]RSZ63874.1 putative addiction module antidote protein [Corynebacterium hylobatis]
MNSTDETFEPFNAADYLNTVDDVAAYLEAIIDEYPDDASAIARALGTIARSRNFSQIAQEAGISREGLYKALSGDGNPSLSTFIKVSRVLGLRLRFEAAA